MTRRVVVVGAGIVGLATAWQISRADPDVEVVVVDKETAIAQHQTGRNSGVIHSGVYYVPGSNKAEMCRRGRAQLLAFVAEHGIAHDLCGKVVVAVEDAERGALQTIAERGRANGVSCDLIGPAALAEIEPAVRGVEALRVDDAGIVDFGGVARQLARLVTDAGGELRLGAEVLDGHEGPDGVVLETTTGDVHGDLLVACAGLHSDRLLATMTGEEPPVTIVPFRGEYHRLTEGARDLCRALIYPVPDPRFPFLGVHLTRHVSGEVLAGPNAVLALDREGYSWGDRSWRELRAVAGHPGMRILARTHWRTGLGEMYRSLSRAAFARALQRMTPDIDADDLRPWRAGVRAQAIFPDGTLADDFVLHTTRRAVHVLNAPSPAATAALAIGETLANRALSLS